MTFDYKDINLIPKMCIVDSRSECDTSIILGKYKFNLPVIPANMESVINEELAIKLAQNNFFYIMHRFHINIIDFIKRMKELNLYTSISIGVNQESYILIDKLVELNLIPEFITIDIAHGHSIKMKNILTYIRTKKEYKDTLIIAGNISTREAICDFYNWGADIIKVGIGPGSACTTYPNTGFGSRDIQAYCVKECYEEAKKYNIPIIADGGISNVCDIAKSLVMGAKLVMIGGMLSGFEESPGKIITGQDGKLYQEFYGSASEYSKTHTGDKKIKNIEGTIKLVLYKNKSIFRFFEELKEALQSSISYGGGKDLSCFETVSFIIKK